MGFHHHYVHGPRLIPRLMGSASGATSLLGAELDGLSIDFTDASLIVRDQTTTSNAWLRSTGDVQDFWRNRSFTSYASPSPKITRDSAGLYKYAPHNLLPMSQEYRSAAWTLSETAVTANAATAPDGTATAAKLAHSNPGYIQKQVTFASGLVVTASAYVKVEGAATYFRLSIYDTAHNETWFLMSGAGSVGTNAAGNTAVITSVGNGWYRVSVSRTLGAANPYWAAFFTDTDNAACDADDTGYLWGAQLNAGPSALTYVPTRAHNLILQSQTLDNGSWAVESASVTVGANTTTAPDGTTTAETLTEAAITDVHQIRTNTSVTATGSTTYTMSVYFKKPTTSRDYAYIQINTSGGTAAAAAIYFDLVNIDVGGTEQLLNTLTIVSTAITDVGNGWRRCSVAFTTSSGNTSVQPYLGASLTGAARSYVGDITYSLYAWGAQIELASSPGKYVTTTTASVYSANYDLPREWDSAGACQGLLVEEARTNICLYSQDFGNVIWEKARATITADAAVAPNGTTTAAKLVEDSTAGDTHYVTQPIATSAAVYTFSVFAKAGERTSINLWVDGTGNGIAYFNLSNGTVSTTVGANVASGSISAAGNGWYRCSIVTTSLTAAAHYFVIGLHSTVSYNGDGASGAYLWHGQVEAGAFITSPIYTGSASVTRAADGISLPTSGVFPFTLATSTIFAKVPNGPAGTGGRIWSIYDSADNSRYAEAYRNNTLITCESSHTGAGAVNYGTPNSFTETNKLAAGIETDNLALYLNGVAGDTDAAITVDNVPTTLALGSYFVGLNVGTFYLSQFMYLPRRMSNGDMDTLTT
jgi:hypothetical protein